MVVLRYSVFWDVMQRQFVVSYQCLETAHRKYQSTLCNFPEEVQPQLNRGGSL